VADGSMTKVSVIIPTYNRAEKVLRAISSVLSQTYEDFELIVIDDGSDDHTREGLSRFKDHILLLNHTENMGVSAARNSGIEKARGEFIAFLDSDDQWMPEKLEVQIDFFRENPDIVACQTEEIWIRKGIRVNPKNRHLKPSGDIFEPSLKLCLVSPSAVMLKRSLLDEVGLFDERFPVCEDYDLWLRISKKYPIYLIKKALVVREGGASDQLSSSLKGMDKFRIQSMLKLLKEGELNRKQIAAVMNELDIKCKIYGEGCLKRGKIEEGNYYLTLPQEVKVSYLFDMNVD
jgi:glycosyltransferase involved in cell wall biosynthesis